MSSLDLATPTIRVRRWVPPAPGMMPSLVSGKAILVLSPETKTCHQHSQWEKLALPPTLKSHPKASSAPPPKAYPSITAIVGIGKDSSSASSCLRLSRKFETCIGLIVRRSRKSAPEQKREGLEDCMRSRRVLVKIKRELKLEYI